MKCSLRNIKANSPSVFCYAKSSSLDRGSLFVCPILAQTFFAYPKLPRQVEA